MACRGAQHSHANAAAGCAAGSSSSAGGATLRQQPVACRACGPPLGGQQPPADGGVPGGKRKRKDAGVKRSANKRCKDSRRFKDSPVQRVQNPTLEKPCSNKEIINQDPAEATGVSAGV